MKTDSIECFLTLANTLNYTEAADRLYITQSALSRLILQMEEELGVVLFSRSRRGVELTAAGRSFYNDSIQFLKMYSDGIARAKLAQNGESGQITLGCHASSTEPLLFDIIEGFSKLHKDIVLDIKAMPTSEIIRSLDNGDIDCAVTSGCPVADGIEKILLQPYLECVVVAKSSPLASRESISINELKDTRIVTMSRTSSSRGYDNIIGLGRDAGFTPHIEAEAESVPHLLAMLAKGDAVTVLSTNYEYMAGDRFAFVPLAEEYTANMGFVYNVENANTCVHTLADYVRDNFEYDGELKASRRDAR